MSCKKTCIVCFIPFANRDAYKYNVELPIKLPIRLICLNPLFRHECDKKSVLPTSTYSEFMLLLNVIMKNTENKISDEVFSSLLYLSRLCADKEESEVLSQQINRLIEYFKILDKFADPDAGNSMYALHDETELRPNTIKESIPQIYLKKMTDEYMDNYFRVPKVLGSGA